ncbi:MAG: metallophosphoesterase [Bradymonadaceae bacterium]|nr:metallophosphoesterase [Lujinxingiaceae bacterium]
MIERGKIWRAGAILMVVMVLMVLGTPDVGVGAEKTLAARSEADVLTVAVISDLNGRYGSKEYRATVHDAVRFIIDDVRPDLVLTTGDMVAGQRADLDYKGMWHAFHAAVSDPLARANIPFAVTPGNHDASASPAFFRERIHFVNEWMARKPNLRFVDASFYPLYYAFELGPALFISMDATTTGPVDDDQRTWLATLLERHKHKQTKIVFGHVPLYPFARGREHEIMDDPALEALFVQHGVDMMITGHHHAFYPGRRGPLRLVGMACLGSGARRLVGTEEPSDQSVTVLRISKRGIESLEAYKGPGFAGKVERTDLPETLNRGAWRIVRDDLE